MAQNAEGLWETSRGKVPVLGPFRYTVFMGLVPLLSLLKPHVPSVETMGCEQCLPRALEPAFYGKRAMKNRAQELVHGLLQGRAVSTTTAFRINHDMEGLIQMQEKTA